jgi:hypothetical protein
MDRKITFLAVVMMLLLLVEAMPLLRAESIVGMEAEFGGYSNRPVPNSFDREGCETDCQERYGTTPYGRGMSLDRTQYYLYARCIEDCNTRFWKDYDRRMKELEKEKP